MAQRSEVLNWLVAFRSPADIWEKHCSFLIGEAAFYFMSLLVLKHALRQGGRYIYLYFGIILHGLVTELLSYLLPDIDSFWHAQGMVMFAGKRLPGYIVLIYTCFIYTSAAAVSRLNLKKWAEPFAVGLGVVLIDLPYDIMGIKLLWWTWHDTDPNIYDRMYWVPWTSYYFHAAFASSFMFLFFGTRRLLCNTEGFQADSFFKELICTLLSGMFAMPLGILQFIPVYHVLHDLNGIHTEVCVFIVLTFYGLIVWAADRRPSKEARSQPSKGWFDELGLQLLIHYGLFLVLAVVAKPEQIQSTGLHEPVGNCSEVSPVMTATGVVLSKKTYLCTEKGHGDYYNEAYFDFHCLPGGQPPKHGSAWYTTCGTPFPNHLEYLVVVGTSCFLGLFVYYQALAKSGRQPCSGPMGQPRERSTPAARKKVQ